MLLKRARCFRGGTRRVPAPILCFPPIMPSFAPQASPAAPQGPPPRCDLPPSLPPPGPDRQQRPDPALPSVPHSGAPFSCPPRGPSTPPPAPSPRSEAPFPCPARFSPLPRGLPSVPPAPASERRALQHTRRRRRRLPLSAPLPARTPAERARARTPLSLPLGHRPLPRPPPRPASHLSPRSAAALAAGWGWPADRIRSLSSQAPGLQLPAGSPPRAASGACASGRRSPDPLSRRRGKGA